jgi:lytic murein transglycosylase
MKARLPAVVMLALSAPPLAAQEVDGPPLVSCLAQIKPEALARGVPEPLYDRLTAGMLSDVSVLAHMDDQPESVTPIWDYLALLVDAEKIADGKRALAEHRAVFEKVSRAYGIDVYTLAALWGIEADYGKTIGRRMIFRSLATLGCLASRRRDYFKGEFLAALRVAATGEVDATQMRGSWAGAFGHPQFMPTVWFRMAVDFDGDGKRDTIGSMPDYIASMANFLKKLGWVPGTRWGYEVKLPAGFNASRASRINRRPLAAWSKLGVKRADGKPLDGAGTAGLILPAGREGPAFLVFKNFDAFLGYNPATSYALAIGLLSDRIRGGGPLVTPWPTDEKPLDRKGRRELQTLLLQRGYAIGDIDGVIGKKTRDAIREIERGAGLAMTGRATEAVLAVLRNR